MYYLTLMLVLPVLGAIFIGILSGKNRQLIHWVARLTAAAVMLLSWLLLSLFEPSIADIQLAEHVEWNRRLGTAYALGIDGISLPMVLLVTLLTFVAVMASQSITERVRSYYFLIFMLEAAMLGVFMAQDWTLFYVFWEMTLIPLFFLIDRWGGARRESAALNFVLYTMGGSVFMLISLLLLFDSVPGHSFAMADLTAGGRLLPESTQVLIFLGFLIGFGVKMPIFPLHGWLPLAHVEAPSAVSILLSGALLKMGAYGLIRAADMLPHAVVYLQGFLATLALVNLIYGGLLAWRQYDLKSMIAYSSISHMGVVLLGIATLNVAGLTGAVMQMVAHGLVAGSLFLLIGLLYERTHTRNVNHYSSLVKVTPRFAFFTILAFIASVGFPGTAGFVAEIHVLIGGFERWEWFMLLLSMGVMVSAAYAIRTVGYLFTGPVRSGMQNIEDLKPHETFAAGLLAFGIVLFGFFPSIVLQFVSSSVAKLSASFTGL